MSSSAPNNLTCWIPSDSSQGTRHPQWFSTHLEPHTHWMGSASRLTAGYKPTLTLQPCLDEQVILYQAGGKAILHPQYKRTYSSISQQRQGSMLGCSTPRLSVCHRLDAPEDAHVNKGMQFGRGKFDILQQQVLPADQYLGPCILVSDAGISIHWLISWNPATRFAGMKHGSIGKMGHISSTCPLKNQQRPWFLQSNGPHKRQVRIFHTLCSSERTCQWLPYHV